MSIVTDLEDGCGGTGYLNCFCGGDLCCCDLNGEIPCGGCGDCREVDEDDAGWYRAFVEPELSL